jgi:LmbE family N-acetylglucosaminyl deacetylase
MTSVIVFAPHPDDAEIGMGGTIALLAARGHRVVIVDVTDGCPTPVGDRATRLAEAEEARRILSAPDNPVRRVLLDLPNRRVEHTLAGRHLLAGQIRAHQARIVFAPHPLDAHPDHVAVTRLAEDARFDAKLTGAPMPGDEGRPPVYPRWFFYYYCSHLRRVPDPSFVIDTGEFAERKRRALEAYRSQFIDNPAGRDLPGRIAAQDAYFGSRIAAIAGEPFFSHEPLALRDLDALP